MSTISAGTTTTTALVQTGDTTGNLVLATGSVPTTALTLNSTTQAATFAGAVTIPSLNATNTFGFKNRIINGGMTIDQRNAGASVATTTATGVNVYTLDRWAYACLAASKFTVQQNAGSVTPPVGFINYLGCTSTSAYSVGTSDLFVVAQLIEGLNFADLGWGTANAKTVTLSAWVYSSLTGTFGGSLKNGSNNRAYPFTYTISSANTWTQISVTIVGDTTGTWLTTNGIGVSVIFSLGCGSGFSATAGAWATGNYLSATGATSVVGTSGATFYITGVQFEVGSQATSFDFRDYGRELILCQRYYSKTYDPNESPYTSIGGGQIYGMADNTGNAFGFVFPVTMRAAPTVYCRGSASATTGLCLQNSVSKSASAAAIGAQKYGYLAVTSGTALVWTGLSLEMTAEL